VADNAAHEDDVDDSIPRFPFTVSRYDDCGDKHECEAVVDGAKAADETQGITVANEEGESISSLGRCVIMGPPI
jgi:hypothetical protein